MPLLEPGLMGFYQPLPEEPKDQYTVGDDFEFHDDDPRERKKSKGVWTYINHMTGKPVRMRVTDPKTHAEWDKEAAEHQTSSDKYSQEFDDLIDRYARKMGFSKKHFEAFAKHINNLHQAGKHAEGDAIHGMVLSLNDNPRFQPERFKTAAHKGMDLSGKSQYCESCGSGSAKYSLSAGPQKERYSGTTMKLDDGRVFPQHEGSPLSWSLGLYHTHEEEKAGFPKMRAVVRAMHEHRPEQLHHERHQLLKSSMGDKMFGHNAKKALNVIDDEMSKIK